MVPRSGSLDDSPIVVIPSGAAEGRGGQESQASRSRALLTISTGDGNAVLLLKSRGMCRTDLHAAAKRRQAAVMSPCRRRPASPLRLRVSRQDRPRQFSDTATNHDASDVTSAVCPRSGDPEGSLRPVRTSTPDR